MAEPRPLLLTVPEVARALSCSPRTVYALIYAGDLVSVKVGALRRVTAAALDQYVASLTNAEADRAAAQA